MLKSATRWIQLLGWMSIVGGFFSLFATFPVGILTGTLSMVSGSFLVRAAGAFHDGNEYMAGEQLRKYFVFTGVLSLISMLIAAGAFLVFIGVLSAAR